MLLTVTYILIGMKELSNGYKTYEKNQVATYLIKQFLPLYGPFVIEFQLYTILAAFFQHSKALYKKQGGAEIQPKTIPKPMYSSNGELNRLSD